MNSSWLASGLVAPVAITVMVPAELVRAKAQSGAISTISAMVNLMFSFRGPRGGGLLHGRLANYRWAEGPHKDDILGEQPPDRSDVGRIQRRLVRNRTLVIATLSAAGVAATLAAGLASSAAALPVQPTAARSATAANMDCMWTRVTTCYSDHE
jgi:hypothetical protein